MTPLKVVDIGTYLVLVETDVFSTLNSKEQGIWGDVAMWAAGWLAWCLEQALFDESLKKVIPRPQPVDEMTLIDTIYHVASMCGSKLLKGWDFFIVEEKLVLICLLMIFTVVGGKLFYYFFSWKGVKLYAWVISLLLGIILFFVVVAANLEIYIVLCLRELWRLLVIHAPVEALCSVIDKYTCGPVRVMLTDTVRVCTSVEGYNAGVVFTALFLGLACQGCNVTSIFAKMTGKVVDTMFLAELADKYKIEKTSVFNSGHISSMPFRVGDEFFTLFTNKTPKVYDCGIMDHLFFFRQYWNGPHLFWIIKTEQQWWLMFDYCMVTNIFLGFWVGVGLYRYYRRMPEMPEIPENMSNGNNVMFEPIVLGDQNFVLIFLIVIAIVIYIVRSIVLVKLIGYFYIWWKNKRLM